MSTQESDGGEENFENLRKCLKKPCTILLRNILKKKFRKSEEIRQAIPSDKLSTQANSTLDKKSKAWNLHIKVLCEIFQSGVCDCILGSPAIGWLSPIDVPESDVGVADDIARIWKIWQKHIENNTEEILSDNDYNKTITILKEIGKRISSHESFSDIGCEYYKEICTVSKGNHVFLGNLHTDALQAGDGNTMQMNVDPSNSCPINIVQVGDNNLILFQLKNTCPREDTTTGNTQKTAVLRSEDPAFEALTANASTANIDEINDMPVLRELNISIKQVKLGSLVITFTMRNRQSLEDNLKQIFNCLFTKDAINDALSGRRGDVLIVSGYIYDPQEYYLDYAPEDLDPINRTAKFHLYSHSTWQLGKCTCDMDIVLTDLLYNLLTYDFSTEENDCVVVLIKGSVISSDGIDYSVIQDVLLDNLRDKITEYNIKLVNVSHCEIQSILPKKNNFQVIIKTKKCLHYSWLVAENGVIFSFLKFFFGDPDEESLFSNIQLMKLGLIIDTRLIQNDTRRTGSTLVIEFQPESKVEQAIDTGVLSEIFTSVIQRTKDPSIEIPEKLKIEVDITGLEGANTNVPTMKGESTRSQSLIVKKTLKQKDDSDIDSAVESDEDNPAILQKLITYRDPEYDDIESDSNDSGVEFMTEGRFIYERDKERVDRFSKTNTQLVIYGIELSEKCEVEFCRKKKTMFHYQESIHHRVLQQMLEDNPKKFKRCSFYIESAHKAVCTNLNFADEVKEIQISGRSKCGKSYTDDEVVVEILGKTKVRAFDKGRRNIESQTRDTNTYGKVLGTIKRNRYQNLKHPVLVCAFDDFGNHMMKPLCKTVPKIQVSHKHSTNKMKFDMFSYDAEKKIVKFKNTFTIDYANRKSFCFLVAIIHWIDMYPFGVILDSISTRNDPDSGIYILRLQYQIPDRFTEGAEKIVNLLHSQEKIKVLSEYNKASSIFTFNSNDDIAEMAYSIEKLSNGKKRISIYIAIPTMVIKKDDYIDKEVRRRGVHFRADDKYQSYMIPEKLCNMIEFKVGEKRNAVSLSFTGTCEHDIDIESIALTKTNVVCQKNYTIDKVNAILEGTTENQEIRYLLNFADRRRKDRLGNATHFCELDSGLDNDCEFMKNKEVSIKLQELTIFTNKTISDILTKRFRNEMPYRCHPAPAIEVLDLWNKLHPDFGNILCRLQECEPVPGSGNKCSVFNFDKPFSYRHFFPFQKNVWELLQEHIDKSHWNDVGVILGMDEIHPWQCLASEDWINVQPLAEYRTANSKTDRLLHFALREDHYMTFTSPLKRYIDMVAHRFIEALLSDQKQSPYTKCDIDRICTETNAVALRQKQFQNGCKILLCGHELTKQPQLFNGFVHEVSNIDIIMCYPSLHKLPQVCKKIPLNILQTRERPSFFENKVHKRDILEVNWQNRIYSMHCKMNRKRNNNPRIRLHPHPKSSFREKQQWINLLKTLFKGKTRNLKMIINDQDKIDLVRSIEETCETEDDVSSEDILGVDSTQICKYSLSFNYGQIVSVQIVGEPEHGMMMPMPQLLDLTNNVKICLQHVREPVNVLSEYAKKSTKGIYDSCREYVSIWVPILTMEIATLSVEDESYTITDLPITFSRRGGSFQLKNSFCDQRDISFTIHSTDFLGHFDDEDAETNADMQDFYVSGSDYLCIRCELKTLKESKSNFLNGAISPKKRYWVGHAKVDDIKRVKTPQEKLSVKFICHKKAPEIPKEMLGREMICHVEIIPKIEVHRRTDFYLKSLERASELAKAIAKRNSVPELDRDHIIEGKLFCRNSDDKLGINLNADQKKAIRKAVTSSFSLIQGPPELHEGRLGLEVVVKIQMKQCFASITRTGKTFAGVALINIFCSINKEIFAKGGKKNFVLFCGPSNKSVDLVTGYLKKSGCLEKLKILRMYGKALECQDFPIPGKVFSRRRSNKDILPDESLKDVTLHHLIREEGKPYAKEIKAFDEKFKSNPKKIEYQEVKTYKKLIGKAVRDEIPKYDVVLCTTSTATSATLLEAARGSIFQVLIDEAGMCTEPECMAVIVATSAKQVVLIGDHKQLQPVVICEEASDLGLQKSLFERYAEKQSSYLTFLRQQYRMNPSLCEFPSNIFYEGKLITKQSPKWAVKTPLSLWSNPKYPYVFCNTEGEEEYLAYTTEEGNEMSRYNAKEIEHVVSIFCHLTKKENISWESINIMSQYNAQCHQIRLALRKKKIDFCNVNTVVASQGGEWDYVIFSLVRSLPDYRIEPEPTFGWCKENLGFITDDHQINVALTRARKGLFIIGNKHLMACEKRILNEMLDHFDMNNCIVEATDFLPKIGDKSKVPGLR